MLRFLLALCYKKFGRRDSTATLGSQEVITVLLLASQEVIKSTSASVVYFLAGLLAAAG